VKATDTYGESTYSDVRSFYVDLTAGPRPPAWVNLNSNGNDMDLEWEEVPGADSYNIDHSVEPYSGFSFLDSSASNSYTHIDACISYQQSYYQVKAVDDDLIRIGYWRDLSGNRLD